MESLPPVSSVAQAFLQIFAKLASQDSRAFVGDVSQIMRS